MNFSTIFLISFIATTLMTAFSYAVSNLFDRQFREPILLKELFYKFKLSQNANILDIFSWTVHYIIGAIFILIYNIFWNYQIIGLTFSAGTFIGFVSGLIAVLGWKIMFHFSGIHNKKQDVWYYIQLVLAHIVFGITAVTIFTIPK